jgi:hypothetical protein
MEQRGLYDALLLDLLLYWSIDLALGLLIWPLAPLLRQHAKSPRLGLGDGCDRHSGAFRGQAYLTSTTF